MRQYYVSIRKNNHKMAERGYRVAQEGHQDIPAL